jgi:hypothetical protein
MPRNVVSTGLGLATTLFLTGCSEGPRLYDLSGAVTYRGQPIPAGRIDFIPDLRKGHDGTEGFAFIKDGRYDTRGGGRGITGGPYVARVHGCDGRPVREKPFGNELFEEYEVAVELPPRNGMKDFDVPVAMKAKTVRPRRVQ